MHSDDSTSKTLFIGDSFEQWIVIVMALVTIIAAVAAYLEVDAGGRSDQALRESQTWLLQSIGSKSRGEQDVAYGLSDAYRQWLELDTLAFLAEQNGDVPAAERYLKMRERIQELTPLLSEQYFDPASGSFPDVKAFESDTYIVETALLTERFVNAATISDGWGDKGDNYVNHLTLLTLALFLYGLATTALRALKWYFIITGTVIGVITLIWMIIVVLTAVERLPDEAMVAYAEGVGLAHQDQHDEAITSLSLALELAPSYPNAYYERAKAHFARQELEQAAADYEAAIEAGREDVNVPWNLGWTYYLAGELEQSIEITEQALAIAPDQTALHFNLGLAQLALGKLEAAQESYKQGTLSATQQVKEAREAGQEPPATLWWYLTASAIDLDNLLNCLYEELCEGTPPTEAIASSDNLPSTAAQLNRELKSLTTALEYTGDVPPESIAARIEPFEIAQAVYDESGQVVAYDPLQTKSLVRGAGVFEDGGDLADVDLTRNDSGLTGELFVIFDYANIQAGQLVIVKVYSNGRESPGLRLVDQWELEAQGEAVLPLTPGGTYTLPPGDYQVEIYVDSHLVQEGEFTIG
jgi:tetratricopeptide (TPR) repeat protein